MWGWDPKPGGRGRIQLGGFALNPDRPGDAGPDPAGEIPCEECQKRQSDSCRFGGSHAAVYECVIKTAVFQSVARLAPEAQWTDVAGGESEGPPRRSERAAGGENSRETICDTRKRNANGPVGSVFDGRASTV